MYFPQFSVNGTALSLNGVYPIRYKLIVMPTCREILFSGERIRPYRTRIQICRTLCDVIHMICKPQSGLCMILPQNMIYLKPVKVFKADNVILKISTSL